jgi:hypothetical protein
MDEWYCQIAGREIGPLASQQLRTMAAKAQILPADRVRRGANGPWIPAQNVKGLFPQAADVGNPQPAVSAASTHEPSPTAAPAPKPRSRPPTPPPPPPPVMPPLQVDVPGDAVLHIMAAAPPETAAPPTGDDLTTFLRSRRHVRQQQMTIAILLAAILGLAIAGLILAIGSSGSSQPAADKPATTGTKRTRAVRPEAESPEALEAREGIESLEPAKHKRLRPDLADPIQQ